MNRRTWLILALLFAITLAAYSPCLNGPFIYDDHAQIVNDAGMHRFPDLHAVVFNGLRQVRVWQNLSFAVNWAISGPQTWSYKLGNLGLHFATAILLMLFLSRAIPEAGGVVLLTTALFLLHPLQFQTVGYVMGRISSLQAFFVLLVLVSYQKGVRPLWIAVLIFLSLLAKDSCALLPFFLIAYEMTLGTQRPSR